MSRKLDVSDIFKVILFDIETKNLGGPDNRIFCISYTMPHKSDKIVTLRCDEKGGEAGMIYRFFSLITPGTITAGYNHRNFDLPILETRGVELEDDYGKPLRLCNPGPWVADFVLWARGTRLKALHNPETHKASYTLATMCGFYGITGAGIDDESFQMAKIEVTRWDQAAAAGDIGGEKRRKAAMRRIVDHCEADVRATTALYFPLVRDCRNKVITVYR